jgi:hypothetical protein
VYIACFRPAGRRVESEPVDNFQDINFEDLEHQQAGFQGKCPLHLLHLFPVSIYRFACWELLVLWEYLCAIPFHVISLLPGIWVEY